MSHANTDPTLKYCVHLINVILKLISIIIIIIISIIYYQKSSLLYCLQKKIHTHTHTYNKYIKIVDFLHDFMLLLNIFLFFLKYKIKKNEFIKRVTAF